MSDGTRHAVAVASMSFRRHHAATNHQPLPMPSTQFQTCPHPSSQPAVQLCPIPLHAPSSSSIPCPPLAVRASSRPPSHPNTSRHGHCRSPWRSPALLGIVSWTTFKRRGLSATRPFISRHGSRAVARDIIDFRLLTWNEGHEGRAFQGIRLRTSTNSNML